jgi:hypothetical protein
MVGQSSESINSVKDSQIIMIGEKIIGEGGGARQYKIQGVYMNALDGLADVLVTKDDKEPRLVERVRKLALYVNTLDESKLIELTGKLANKQKNFTVTELVEGKVL